MALNELSLWKRSDATGGNDMSHVDHSGSSLPEVVKCVVVGDTNVGKTRLICARACNASITQSQLMATHVPTVWAIDQYKLRQDVMDLSHEIVDGVRVSLRLWDTFGDHGKDRRFAYGRADVVVICLSLINRQSLKHVACMWVPEVRRNLPRVPIIIVGTHLDMRCRDVCSYNQQKSVLTKSLKESDIILPDDVRLVIEDMRCPYYESSVLSGYGVSDVFDNAIRAALLYRRSTRVWNSKLKFVNGPQLQAPYRPPTPYSPPVHIAECTFDEDFTKMFQNDLCCNIWFLSQSVSIPAHSLLLIASSDAFQKLLLSECVWTETSTGSDWQQGDDRNTSRRTRSRCNSPTSLSADLSYIDADTEDVYDDVITHGTSPSVCVTTHSDYLKHSAFQQAEVRLLNNPKSAQSQCCNIPVIILTLRSDIPLHAFQTCLQYLYSGTIDTASLQDDSDSRELVRVASYLQLVDIIEMIENCKNNETLLNELISLKFLEHRTRQISELFLTKRLLSDVEFILDNGRVMAHKTLLTFRSEVMAAMLCGHFMESSNNIVELPGTTKEAFNIMLQYLYTDTCPLTIHSSDALDTIALSNRLCLPRLVNMMEEKIVEELTLSHNSEEDISLDVIKILTYAQLHNADQLSGWCLTYLCRHYNEVCHCHGKTLKSLGIENEKYLQRHRWPPIWYLKEKDVYDKKLHEKELIEERQQRKRSFSGSRRRKICFWK